MKAFVILYAIFMFLAPIALWILLVLHKGWNWDQSSLAVMICLTFAGWLASFLTVWGLDNVKSH